MRRLSVALFLLCVRVAAATDIGVIRDASAGCPAGSEQIIIDMDDEDDPPRNSSVSGWTGAIAPSAIGTAFVFCRVNGELFKRWRHEYLVLKLSAKCPSESYTTIARLFDNEDDGNVTKVYGNIYPNRVGLFVLAHERAYRANDTILEFCYFAPHPTTTDKPPNLGVPYGVFAKAEIGAPWLDTGRVYTDDEDDDDDEIFDKYGTLKKPWLASRTLGGCPLNACAIIGGSGMWATPDRNSTLLTAKAHDGKPDPCLEGTCTSWTSCYLALYSNVSRYYLNSQRQCCRGGKLVSESDPCFTVPVWWTTIDATAYAARTHNVLGRNHLELEDTRLTMVMRRNSLTTADFVFEPVLRASLARSAMELSSRSESALYSGVGTSVIVGGGAIVFQSRRPQWSIDSRVSYRTFLDLPDYNPRGAASRPTRLAYRSFESSVMLRRAFKSGRYVLSAGGTTRQGKAKLVMDPLVLDVDVDTTQVKGGLDAWTNQRLMARIDVSFNRNDREVAFAIVYNLRPILKSRPITR